jgi:hypothetical protein
MKSMILLIIYILLLLSFESYVDLEIDRLIISNIDNIFERDIFEGSVMIN